MDKSERILAYIKRFCSRKRSRSPNRHENFIRLSRKPTNSYGPFESAHKSTLVIYPDTHLPFSPKYLLRALSNNTKSAENLQKVLAALTEAKNISDQRLGINSQQIYKAGKSNGVGPAKESGLEDFLGSKEVIELSREDVKNLWEKVEMRDDHEFFAQVQDVRLTYLDAKKIRAGREVNDEIINGYVNLIKRCKDVHIFKTYFFQYLETMDQTQWDAQKLSQIINDSGLENLTDKDYLIIPANISENHWVIIAMNNKKKTIEYYDSLGTRNMDKICGIIERMIEALGMEHYDWEGMEVPRQQNSFESWIFALKTAQALAANLDFGFNSENIKHYRKIILAELRDGKIYVE